MRPFPVRAAVLSVLAAAAAATTGPLAPSAADPVAQAAAPLYRASTSSYGVPASAVNLFPSVSADGRWVAFYSNADNLVPEVRSRGDHIYLKDLDTGRVVLVSADAAGIPLSGDSAFPQVNGDGTRVAFTYDDDGGELVYVKEIVSGDLTVVSTNAAGEPGNGDFSSIGLSDDGRSVVFASTATNLTVDENNPDRDVFVKDIDSGEVAVVASASDGTQADAESGSPSISADGRRVAFSSAATNLDPRATGVDGPAIFVKDVLTGQLTLVSCDQACLAAAVGSEPQMSATGTHVAFTSYDDLLDPGTGLPQVWVKDLTAGSLALASASTRGRPGDGQSVSPQLSADGRLVTFGSNALNLVPGVTTYPQVYRKDLRTGRTLLVSQYGGRPSRSPASEGDISGSGGTVAFQADGGAFSGVTDGSSAVYVVRAGRGAPVYGPPGGSYTGVTASRLLDTRTGLGVPGPGRVTPATPVRLTVTGRAGVPVSGVSAVALNVTVVDAAGNGYLTGYAGDASRPTTALLNYPAAATRATLTVLPVAPDGTVVLHTSQSAHLLADVAGWFSTSATASMTEGRWQDLPARRIVETRVPGSPIPPVGPGQKVDIDVEALGLLPQATKTVILNVTAVGPSASGYITVYPYLQTRPTVSTLNFRSGETVSNRVIVPLVQGRVSVYNYSGTTNLLVDVAGYSTTGDVPTAYSYGSWYLPLPGTRILDTRSGSGGGLLGPGDRRSIDLSSWVFALPRVHGPVQAVVGSLAGLDATATGYLATTLIDDAPNGTFDVVTAPGPPISNAVASATRGSERVTVYNSLGTTHAVWDINGILVCGAYCLRPPGP